jgi:hypothetical protein
MQVVHYIPHSRYKITVFKSGNRFIVKFDDADHDLSIKFREGEASNLQEVIRQIDDLLIEKIDQVFSSLAQLRLQRFNRTSGQFQDII